MNNDQYVIFAGLFGVLSGDILMWMAYRHRPDHFKHVILKAHSEFMTNSSWLLLVVWLIVKMIVVFL